MKTAITLAILVAAVAGTVSVQAQTYQWRDKNGHTVISDTPPPGSAKTAQIIGGAPPAPTVAPAAGSNEKTAEAAKTTAEKDLEFKKRQQDAKEKADKDAKEQAVAAEKKENCERAKRNLAALESNQPVGTVDENGQRQVMDGNQREQEIERARKIMADSCAK